MKESPSLSNKFWHIRWLKRSACSNEQWFNGKRTIVQAPMNNASIGNEQWCDDERTMRAFFLPQAFGFNPSINHCIWIQYDVSKRQGNILHLFKKSAPLQSLFKITLSSSSEAEIPLNDSKIMTKKKGEAWLKRWANNRQQVFLLPISPNSHDLGRKNKEIRGKHICFIFYLYLCHQ